MDCPAVATAFKFRQLGDSFNALSQFIHVFQSRSVYFIRGHDKHILNMTFSTKFHRSLRSKRMNQASQKQFALPRTHENMTNLENCTRIPWLPSLWSCINNLVLHRKDIRGCNKRIYTFSIGFEHRFCFIVESCEVRFCAGTQTSPSSEQIHG